MALTFEPPPPAFSPRVEETPRVRSVRFGDGYEGRYGDGLNTLLLKVTVPWRAISAADAGYILGFLRQHQGRNWFYWILPPEGAPRKMVARSWTWQRTEGTAHTRQYFDIDAQLDEVPDLFG